MSGLFKPCNHSYQLPLSLATSLPVESVDSKATSLISRSDNEPKVNQDIKHCPNSLLKAKLETEFQSNNERIKNLLLTGFMSDVTFIVENEDAKEERINCHKIILASRSRVFNRLFNGPNAEKSKEIKINDVKAKDFKNLLKYIYYDDEQVDAQSFITTFVAAEKYAVRTFTKVLINKIKYLNGDETCILLKELESSKITNKEFQKELTTKYQLETKKIIDSNEFLHLNADTLKDLLSSPILNCSEIDLYKVVMKWAKNRCSSLQLQVNAQNLKRTMSRLIYLFRYTSFSLKEFANGPGKLKLLNDNESVDVFLYLTSVDMNTSSLPKQLTAIKRQIPPALEVSFISQMPATKRCKERCKEISNETVQFKTNCEIYLKGVNITQRNYVGELEYIEGELKVFKKSVNNIRIQLSNKKIVDLNDEMYQNSDDKNFDQTIHINLVYPILIEPNTDYIIEFEHKKTNPYDGQTNAFRTNCANIQFDFKIEKPLSLMDKLLFYKI